ncbi:MAG TPA: peptidase M13 [Elusimicrobia bacterium]|nr:peptidase M13 [Elusimicrobiota bacterium]HBT62032.1 peptidase M13 [Elusimicrobiota bacterium]
MGPVESGWLHFKASSWAKLGRHKAPLVKEEGPISAASVKGVQPAQAAALSNTAKLVVAAKARLAILVGKLAAKWHQLYGKKQLGLGVDISAMDKTVRPQDDFFRYVNGTWLKNFKMPADKSRFGVFDQLIEAADIAVRGIIEEVSAEEHAPGTDQQRIADFYKSFLNTDAVEAIGLQSVDADLRKIERIKAKEELTGLFAQALSDGIDTPVGLYVDQDAKNPSAYITGIQQSGLGLPDREYYFKDDEATEKIRAKYLEYVTTLFSLSGEDEAEAKAKSVFALEKALAQHHWTQEENRDVGKTYNKRAIRDLGTMAGGFDWGGYLRAVKIRTEETEVVVAQPSYFAGFAKVLADQPLKAWKLYMKARTLDAAAPFLPKAFVEARFEYMGRTLSGQPEMEPRWKRGVGLVNGALGELVGRIYVEKYFPESSRKRMKRLVENLRAAYAERIQGLDWMGQETKEKALEKLRKFTPKIGYPDKWRDYSRLEVKADDLLGNVRRSNRVDHDRMVSKLGQPMDRGEWYMTPQTVSAYYNAAMNEIVFPAAFLQAPFFNPDADDAVNYGAIGGAIGHEMSHGFDDVGAQFDGDGMLRNWWTPQDKDAFEARAAKLVDQYDAFEPLPGVHVNGKLTLGENIGDLGGLTVAFRAYQLSLRGKKAPVIEGFTGEQRFFLGWAQVWRSAIRDEMLRLRIGTDPHSPAQYRVNGVVRNMPEFYEAENVREGDKLFLSEKDRVGIW